MADGFSITFSDEWLDVERRLRLFGEQVSKDASIAALRATATLMRASAREKVSRSSEKHFLKVKGTYVEISPGNLKSKIRFRKIKKENTDPGTLRYQVYVMIKYAWYAKFLEFGRSNMAPQPFMRPAFEENVAKLTEVFKERVYKFISDGGFL